jgi:hypothetical protein
MVDVQELQERKETMNTMMERFQELKRTGRHDEAFKMLLEILVYANNTLKIAAGKLKQVKEEMAKRPKMESGPKPGGPLPKSTEKGPKPGDVKSKDGPGRKPKKMIVIPKDNGYLH